jgi:hypothetical protein
MFEVTFYLKSGNAVAANYEDEEVVDQLADVIVDPTIRVIVLEDDGNQIFVPTSQIEYVGVKDVQ